MPDVIVQPDIRQGEFGTGFEITVEGCQYLAIMELC